MDNTITTTSVNTTSVNTNTSASTSTTNTTNTTISTSIDNQNQQKQNKDQQQQQYFESKTSFLSSELISKNIGERLKSFAKSSLKHFNTFNKKLDYDDNNNDTNPDIQLHSIVQNNSTVYLQLN